MFQPANIELNPNLESAAIHVHVDDNSCEKEIRARIGKANAAFGRLETIWKSISCGIKTKVRLYEAVVLSTLLYGSGTWPMTMVNGKNLDPAHNKWLRRILHIY